jgi:hypothetical protein
VFITANFTGVLSRMNKQSFDSYIIPDLSVLTCEFLEWFNQSFFKCINSEMCVFILILCYQYEIKGFTSSTKNKYLIPSL